MKKRIISACMLGFAVFSVQAQDISKNALGLRLGSNDGFGGEVSYQRGLSGNNRLELDLGWRNSEHTDAIKLAGIYQWVWNIDQGFNWYAGVGGGLANASNQYRYKNKENFGKTYKESYTYLFAAGDIGIEYNFDIPLLLSLDFRPEIYFNDKVANSFGPDIALGVRYQF
ncbi:hypothetical protein [Flavobacterium crassostreae]|uniref:Outer membrane protein beta-barrel domain-containing protein n=1 Tax=Flavobacterium crassostreae TaxID=1763534 RepID=A0A1B9DYV9_9FLAO|nr:hypothetical protein [Flavobacterium crassostreae]OCB74866.1 hypothetical protein LPBF_09655 [Flavobacterium crassostreae]